MGAVQNFKVGDFVIWAKTGKKYTIIADKQIPIIHDVFKEIFPEGEIDFFIAEYKEDGSFSPYCQAKKEDLILSS